jgi:hypothetical protein
VPTKRRRHTITETPAVERALEELRHEVGEDPIEIPELVILGAREKVARLRAERGRRAELIARLARRIRDGAMPVDHEAADEVRRTGWSRG